MTAAAARVGDTRTEPICPELAKLLRWHIEEFGYSPDGKLFTSVKGGELPDITIRRAWTAARAEALTEEEQQASPLAKRIYDLRHACLSLWLNAGVPPTQVAAWAVTRKGRRPIKAGIGYGSRPISSLNLYSRYSLATLNASAVPL
jgi:hypothetical protein